MDGRELRDKIAGAVYGLVIGGAVRTAARSFDGKSLLPARGGMIPSPRSP